MEDKARAEACCHGLILPQHIELDRLQRFPGAGRTKGKDGWVWLKSDCCHWGDWRTGLTGTTFADRETDPALAAVQRRQWRANRELAEERGREERHRAIARVRVEWQKATPATATPYTDRKGVTPVGMRIGIDGSTLLVPGCWKPDTLVTLQRISPCGRKRFAKGAPVAGAWFAPVRPEAGRPLFITEGAATALTILEQTGATVVAAFSCSNLMAVARYFRERLPEAAITIAGDDDRQTPSNPGRTAAVRVGRAIGARVIFPRLCRCCTCSDFNDWARCRRRVAP